MIDCQQIADRVSYDAPMLDSAGSFASFLVSQRSSTVVDIQDMTLLCGINKSQECCEIPGKKVTFLIKFSCQTQPFWMKIFFIFSQVFGKQRLLKY